MRDYLTISSSPYDEDCAQVGDPMYRQSARAECRAFIAAIRNVLGPEPDGAMLGIKSFQHDFGTYYEVVCYYDDELPESVDYAFRCEAESPATWAEGEIEWSDGTWTNLHNSC